MQQAIEKQGTLTHTTVHGVIVGIARSGKDCLMKRLLGEWPTDKSPSTGVAEKAIQVRVEKTSSSTVSACVEDSKWIRLTFYDDEAIEMMTQLTIKQKLVESYESSEVITEVPDSNAEDINPTHKEDSQAPSHKSPMEIFKEALRTRGLQGLRQHLKAHWSIYLSNTGGQMEFQELLPLLVSGPSMFFVTFRLDQDLNQRYEIEYEVTSTTDDGAKPKIFKYKSSATPLETILQTLASIDAVGTYDYSSQWRARTTLTYKVFIIGTHRDVLEASIGNRRVVQSKIKEIDQTIIESVQSASYFRHIRFSAMDRMIFAVNNFSVSDDDFKLIRSDVQKLVNTGDFMTTSPSHWLIYSLVLRQLKNQIENYDDCFRIARSCGITDDEEHQEALHFIHTKMGIIRYFPIDDLKQIVILDPQVLFDRVTELIVETFTFESAGRHSAEDFKRGIFSSSEFKKISHARNPDSLLTPDRFAQLLEHLRIAAPFHQDGILKYFFPCALSHADELQHQVPQNDPTSLTIPPLVVSFECGYRPMGLAGALITYLITNERGSKDFEWVLLTEEIYRDQISFSIEPSCDTVVLKMLPTHLEITCLPDLNDLDRDYCPIQKTCIEICKAIKAGIERVNSDINYINNTEPLFTFYCQTRACAKPNKRHPAKLLYSSQNEPVKLKCLKTQRPHKFPLGYEIWSLQELKTCTATCNLQPRVTELSTRCDSSHYGTLFNQLKKHAAKWRDIGTNLGFQQGELDNIQAAPKYLMEAPQSWLRAMLSKWLEWAPNDGRGSDQYATLEALKDAVSKAGLGRTAENLTINIAPPTAAEAAP